MLTHLYAIWRFIIERKAGRHYGGFRATARRARMPWALIFRKIGFAVECPRSPEQAERTLL